MKVQDATANAADRAVYYPPEVAFDRPAGGAWLFVACHHAGPAGRNRLA